MRRHGRSYTKLAPLVGRELNQVRGLRWLVHEQWRGGRRYSVVVVRGLLAPLVGPFRCHRQNLCWLLGCVKQIPQPEVHLLKSFSRTAVTRGYGDRDKARSGCKEDLIEWQVVDA